MRHYSTDRIDLRSDTVTQPTPAMREAMHAAAVGDDVLGDDPTVSQLERRVAEMCGKEAALFVPSGTMSNAIALRCHTSPGDEIITAKNSHIYIYEGGGYAALCGASVALVDVHGGLMRPEDVKGAIRKQAGSLSHYPDGTLVCVENTSNRGGGACYPQTTLDEIAAVAKANNCAVHARQRAGTRCQGRLMSPSGPVFWCSPATRRAARLRAAVLGRRSGPRLRCGGRAC